MKFFWVLLDTPRYFDWLSLFDYNECSYFLQLQVFMKQYDEECFQHPTPRIALHVHS